MQIQFPVLDAKVLEHNEKCPRIAAVIMVKDEESTIERTLSSLQKNFQDVIMFDTGSTDKTIEIARKVCQSLKLEFHLLEGTFVDFSTSRNAMLDFADKVATEFNIHWFILLDANDQVRGSEYLPYIVNRLPFNISVAHVLLNWDLGYGKFSNHRNTRLIRPNRKWRYTGVVHEYLRGPKRSVVANEMVMKNIPGEFNIYQNRTVGSESSSKRWKKDYWLLLRMYAKEKPANERTVFYLAQTCKCLKMYEQAIYWYWKRTLFKESFAEEVYVSFYEMGLCWYEKYVQYKTDRVIFEYKDEELQLENYPQTTLHLNPEGTFCKTARVTPEQCLDNALRFLAEAMNHQTRAEPLVWMAHIYNIRKQYFLGMMMIDRSIPIPIPDIILWYDEDVYEFKRQYYLGQMGQHVGKRDDALKARLQVFEKRSFVLEHLTDYVTLRDDWKLKITEPCYFKRNMKVNSITLVLLLDEREFLLPTFFNTLMKQSFPHNKINLFIAANDASMVYVIDWLKKSRKSFAECKLEKYQPENQENLRIESIKFAKQNHSHYLMIKHYMWMKNPDTLKILFEAQKPVIAPLMRNANSMYANFNAAVDSNGYYMGDPSYPFLITTAVKGIIDVPVVKELYLIHYDVLDKVSFQENSARDEYVKFCNNCRAQGILQYLDTHHIYGNIAESKTVEEMVQEPFFIEYQ